MIDSDINNRASFEMEVDRVCADVAEMLVRKNRDYGSSVFSPPILAPDMDPLAAIDVRLSDKWARSIELERRKGKPEVDESLDDTWLDIAGYVILRKIFMERLKAQEQQAKG